MQTNHGASLVAQLVKKKILLPIQETHVRSLGQEDPLQKEMATHSGMLAHEQGDCWATVLGVTESQT